MCRSYAIIVRWIGEQDDKANISMEVTTSIPQKCWTVSKKVSPTKADNGIPIPPARRSPTAILEKKDIGKSLSQQFLFFYFTATIVKCVQKQCNGSCYSCTKAAKIKGARSGFI